MTDLKKVAIEQLRHKLIALALERGSLTNPEVIAISQELDDLLIRAQKSKDAYTYKRLHELKT